MRGGSSLAGEEQLVAALVQRNRQEGSAGTVNRATTREAIEAQARRALPLLGSRREPVVERAVAELCGLGEIESFLDDPAIDEIMINGPGPVWIERAGVLAVTTVVFDLTSIQRIVERMLAGLSLRVDRLHPICDARLSDGSRVHVVIAPIAVNGPCVTIRKFRHRRFELSEFAGEEVQRFLGAAVRDRRSIVVTGGTSTGKTSLVGALAGLIDATERIVTVEDTAELRLGGHVVALEARPATAEGLGAVALRDLVRAALRMRPDRIIVGEVRGAEAFDMVQALNTGHSGSFATVHANSPEDALRRIEAMVMIAGAGIPFRVVREMVRRAVELVVHVGKGPDGRRQVLGVHEPSSGTA